MSKFNHIWKHYHRNNNQTPEQYIEAYLTRLEKFDKARLDFENLYQSYLSQEREKRLDKIIDALSSSARMVYNDTCVRVVSGHYGDDPLCTYGSLVDSGRFNFGSTGSFYSQFDCHYIANNFETAFQEKYHYSNEELHGSVLSPSGMALLEAPESFNSTRIEVSLSNCLDLRNPNSLNSFFDVIAEIIPSDGLQWEWKKWCQKYKQVYQPLITVQEIETLFFSIYDPNFKQYESYLDIPSNSQWLGHYARLAGIQAIIYLSVRNETGYNLAVFPTNLKETDSYLKLTDDLPYVDHSRRQMISENCEFFRCTFAELRSQSLILN